MAEHRLVSLGPARFLRLREACWVLGQQAQAVGALAVDAQAQALEAQAVEGHWVARRQRSGLPKRRHQHQRRGNPAPPAGLAGRGGKAGGAAVVAGGGGLRSASRPNYSVSVWRGKVRSWPVLGLVGACDELRIVSRARTRSLSSNELGERERSVAREIMKQAREEAREKARKGRGIPHRSLPSARAGRRGACMTGTSSVPSRDHKRVVKKRRRLPSLCCSPKKSLPGPPFAEFHSSVPNQLDPF